MTTDFDIQDDSELKSLSRTLTGYDSNTIDDSALDNHLQIAKLKLQNKTGTNLSAESDPFYSDSGLSQALLYTVAIQSKAEVENVSVDSWDVGDVFIETRRASDDEQAQFQQWAKSVAEGLRASEYGTDDPLPKVTNSFP